VAGLRQPLHDGTKALRDPRRRITYAVIVDKEEPHAP
jgi:hypothetical protein